MFAKPLLDAHGVLFGHVGVRAPAPLTLGPGVRVEEAHVAHVLVHVGDADVLRAPRVDHHVPGVTVEPVRPVVVALQG